MLRQILLLLFFGATLFSTNAQNASPYWSLAGNSNASTSPKLGTTNLIPLGLYTNNAVRATIATNGNVGIGTTSPQQRLHVEGSGNQGIFVSTSSLGTTSGSGLTNYVKATPTASGQRLGYFQFGSRGGSQNAYTTAGISAYASGAWSSTSRPTYLSFETTTAGSITRTERLRINANGNVGIGTTSPSQKLHVSGNAYVSGNVGIGVTNPVYALDVAGRIRLNSSGGGTAGLWLNNLANTNSVGFVGAVNDNYIGLWGTNLGWGLVMNTTTGNVGIGTEAPSSRLHVSGLTSAIYGVANGGSNDGLTTGIEARGSADVGRGTFLFGMHAVASGGFNAYGVYAKAGSGSYTNAAGYFDGPVWASSYNTISDRKFKQDIAPLANPLRQLMKLRPASYQFKTKEYKQMNLPQGRQLGLIADEVKVVFPELVQRAVHPAVYDEKDRTKILIPQVEYEGVNYQGLIPVLIASVKELKVENDELKARLDKLETLLTEREHNSQHPSMALLEQSVPNPSHSMATIPYHLPNGTTSARLILANAKGQALKEMNIPVKGTGQVSLNTSALPSGVYNYTLWINGQQADSKQLIIAR